jgi:hypothetical protein
MSSAIQTIPFEGNSGDTPSGAIRFGRDWPGLFLRGDSCMELMMELDRISSDLKDRCGYEGLPRQLAFIKKTIEEDVIIRD